jgi:hypothetical protein
LDACDEGLKYHVTVVTLIQALPAKVSNIPHLCSPPLEVCVFGGLTDPIGDSKGAADATFQEPASAASASKFAGCYWLV